MTEGDGVETDVIINAIREVTPSELEGTIKAIADLNQYRLNYGLYRICERNFAEILSSWDTYSHLYAENQSIDYQIITEIEFEMDRRILNYLSSARAFLDHFDYQLKHLDDPRKESFLSLFEEKRRYHYDRDFSFRFLEKLRNYVQHCGLPVGSLKLSTRLPKTENELRSGRKAISSSGIFFDRDTLLSTFNWKKLKEELAAQPQQIEVIPHVKNHKTCIDDIYSICKLICLTLYQDSWDFLYRLHEEVQSIEPGGYPVILTSDDPTREYNQNAHTQSLDLNILHFPVYTMDMMANHAKSIIHTDLRPNTDGTE